jgi:hypothetical protein
VIYRPIHCGPIQGVSLLAAYADDLANLLRCWSNALRASGVYFVHVLLTPASALWPALQSIGLSVNLPYTRSPYYLTVKPLRANTPETLLDFTRWDCVGGDVL